MIVKSSELSDDSMVCPKCGKDHTDLVPKYNQRTCDGLVEMKCSNCGAKAYVMITRESASMVWVD